MSKKREIVGLSFEELNHFTAHKQHQKDRDAYYAQKNAEEKEPPTEKVVELGEGDGF